MLGFKRRRRNRLRRQAFPPEWTKILRRNCPYHRALPARDKRELEGHILVFLAEKHFEGCGGLVITDEVRVTVAAHACVLLLHRKTNYYPRLESILVYPHAYLSMHREPVPGGHVVEGEAVHAGESWREGAVVLSWDDVRGTVADLGDGQNVVLHEFAHQLDEEDGSADGAPALATRSMYAAWARVLSAEYEQLLADVAEGRQTLIDEYGATNPAEFFAVVTEAFFEKPRQLKRRHPELYEMLQLFYQQDPATLVTLLAKRTGGAR